MIYSIDTIDDCHRQLRKVTKTKTAYRAEDDLRKVLYLATADMPREWTGPVRDWTSPA